MTRLIIDTEGGVISIQDSQGSREVPFYSREAFELLSPLWVKVGWAQRYSYSFTWMGRPVVQLPEDMMRIQEAIFEVRPAVVIETGVAHGGSLIYYASLLNALGGGRVVGVDIEIKPHNREAIEAHELAEAISLIVGSSTDRAVVERVRELIRDDGPVLVILDSNHTRAHVAAELEAYSPLVTRGSYIVATDGIMCELADVPGGDPSWADDNPAQAAREFAEAADDFELVPPPRPFDESDVGETPTYWPDAWLRRTN